MASRNGTQHGGPSRNVLLLIAFLIIQSTIYCFLFLGQVSQNNRDQLPAAASTAFHEYLGDESNVRIPTHMDGKQMSMEERLRYLELKFNAHTNFGVKDPFVGSNVVLTRDNGAPLCKNASELIEFGCVKGFEGYDGDCEGDYDHVVCLDDLPKPRQGKTIFTPIQNDKPKCLVYDFGVREQPQFGAVMARVFGCEVHAFDPSPVSLKWWKSKQSKNLKSLGNYHFHQYGSGGVDGLLTLNEYNWGQVSILKYPSTYIDCRKAEELKANNNDDDKVAEPIGCEMVDVEQKEFEIPVKTLPAIRKALGHEDRVIDILKLDVEGSEYSFLENALDRSGGCPSYIKQLALEWHHQDWDVRYGENASPNINSLTTLLHACGLKLFWHYNTWPNADYIYNRMGLHNIRYSLSSYINVNSPQNVGNG